MTPFFSVVVSVYNKQDYILNTLNSVFKQTFQDFEVIAVNDGSNDNSASLLESISDNRLRLINQKNKGASAARNIGIEYAKGQFIALLDGDDIWKTTFLTEIKAAIDSNQDYVIFSSAIAHKFDDKIRPVSYSFSSQNKVLVLDYFKNSRKHTILTGSSTVFRKSILKQTGNFSPEIKSGQDTDLWIRFGIYYKIVFVNKVLVYYLQNKQSLSNTTTNISLKSRFDQYKNEESVNTDLRYFLDRNRFSLALLSKLNDDKKALQFYAGEISKENWTIFRQILLLLPNRILKLLLDLKQHNQKNYYPSLKAKNRS